MNRIIVIFICAVAIVGLCYAQNRPIRSPSPLSRPSSSVSTSSSASFKTAVSSRSESRSNFETPALIDDIENKGFQISCQSSESNSFEDNEWLSKDHPVRPLSAPPKLGKGLPEKKEKESLLVSGMRKVNEAFGVGLAPVFSDDNDITMPAEESAQMLDELWSAHKRSHYQSKDCNYCRTFSVGKTS